MFIQVAETPNPNALKFILEERILEGGEVYHFSSKESCESELANQLFTIENITDIFLGANFISVSINDYTKWNLLKPKILSIITDFLITGASVIAHNTNNVNVEKIVGKNAEEQEVIDRITEMFEDRIRPAVAMDGGDILFRKYIDGKVYISMYGACSGCPSAGVTLKNGIENMLKYYIPEVTEVIDIEQYD